MAKQIINETQLIDIVKKATSEALSKIFEGATWDSVKKGFKDGYNGVYNNMSDKKFDKEAKKYIKNGKYNDANYQDFSKDKVEYQRARNINDRANSNLDKMKNNVDSYTFDDMEKAKDLSNKTKQTRDDAAMQMVGSRPGIIGKGQRAAAMGSVRMGRLANKIKNKAINFVHDKIGLEEENK